MASSEIISQPVFLELSTSDPGGEGHLVRIEACREQDGKLQTLERLIRAPRLTLAQSRMAGVTNSELDSAPELDAVLQDLLDFAEGSDAWVVEDGAIARTALRAAGRACGYPGFPKAQIVALDELAAVVAPTKSYRRATDRRVGVPPASAVRERLSPANRGVGVSPVSAVGEGLSPANRGAGVSPVSAVGNKLAQSDGPLIRRRRLPHLTATGGVYFVTFRLADSVPRGVADEWHTERETLKKQSTKKPLTAEQQKRLDYLTREVLQEYIDAGHGNCILRDPASADLVQRALLHFHLHRYYLIAWCIMPNHVHAVLQPGVQHDLQSILHSWKSFTAHELNQKLNSSGAVWMEESYDHLVRDEDDFYRVVRYTLQNPEAAGLQSGFLRGERLEGFDPARLVGGDGSTGEGGREARPTNSNDRPANGGDGRDARPTNDRPANGGDGRDARPTNGNNRPANGGDGRDARPTNGSERPANGGDGRDAHPTFWLRDAFNELLSALLRLPLPVLSEMNWLINRSDHPLKKLLRSAEAHAVKHQFSETFDSGKVALEKLFKDYSEIIDRLTPVGEKSEDADSDEPPPPPSKPVTGEEIDALLGASGPLSRALDGFEDRPEQLAMARRVAEALSTGKHLMVEAGTGVGKSLAYLVPAALFAQRAGRPVVVSTHTKNLQSQLFHKDLPFLQKHAGVEFTTALLKGRPNYLCLRKFMYTMHEAAHELDDEERARMLPLITWATQTETGDVSEMEVFSREQDGNLWSRLHTVGDDCLKRQCPFYKRCFVYKARGTARTADIVVANHSLIFAELQIEAGTLPPYSEVVFDEGHKLEDVATEHLATEVTPRRIYMVLNKLYRTTPGASAGKGLLPTLLMHVDNCRAQFTDSLFTSIREHILNCMQAIQPAIDGGDFFFHTMRSWTETPVSDDSDGPIESYVPRERGRNPIGTIPNRMPEPFDGITTDDGEGGRDARPTMGRPQGRSFMRNNRRNQQSDERKRFSSATLRQDDAERLTNCKEAAIATLGRLRQALDKLEDDFAEIRKRSVPRARELIKEIQAQNLFIEEIIGDIEFVIRGEEPNWVYWSERLGRKAARVVAAPLDVAKLLYEQLYEKKRSIILASATLSVRDIDAGEAAGLTPWKMPPVQIRDDSLEPPAGHDDERDPGRVAEKPHPKSFEFLKNRLGLSLCSPDKLSELLLGSPFNYPEQCRLLIPTFLPEPGYREREFNTAFTQMVGDLVLASQGRAMVLYTSYTALEAGAQTLRQLLAPEGIEVLAQGSDGSRESLLERLKTGERTVLLGTASFWEGVDVRGEALSLLIIAKLPFAVFTDPIIQGRCELLEASGKDAFLHFSVPNAILRLRQGFGRLIRSKSDRGIVVLADKRVLTKRYGAAFLRALPAQAKTITSQDQLLRITKEFLQAQ